MSTILFFLTTSFLLNLLGLSLHRTHFMSILICMESMMLITYLTLSTISSTTNTPTSATMPILLLAMSACEAGTGLALLVATSRTHGTDHMKTLNLLKC
uniref:NADH-ubiquinone oxidoreductase chain 4L n=1 Tax=Australolacerta australis TaxID=410868 RepID=A0A8A3WJW5_9SAUR|nr:NADH dehydrogenase subunit 4L [Australolacerta australis]QTA72624.1 NADH dehydrogenase subunit 4L [Australolacerta australis]